jgi:hypothetical protein
MSVTENGEFDSLIAGKRAPTDVLHQPPKL